MSNIQIIAADSEDQKRAFLRLPEHLYTNDPNWVCPLRIERRDFFDPQKNPFFDGADVQLFLARRNGRDVGRISAHIYHAHNRVHNERTGFFGFFECEKDFAIARALWDAAATWLAEREMERMRGPANFTTNHEVGFLADGFDTPPVVMMPHTHAYYIDFAEEYGFRKAMDLYAYYAQDSVPVPERVERLIGRIAKRSGATIRPLDMKHFDREVEAIQDIYDSAWAPNWGFVPMTKAEFAHMAKDMKQIVDPRVVLIVEVDGKVAGFSLALPDINQVLIRMNGRLFPFGLIKLLWHTKIRHSINRIRVLVMGVLPEYQKRGIDQLLHYETRLRGPVAGYHDAETSWILETNTMMNAVAESLGHERYKTYRVYDYPLT
ncbi:MAG TPA: N-acetyltransferase [Acidobacteriota bacterium]|nr:N-acetyltransferase [Acidobacteriota bacterium]